MWKYDSEQRLHQQRAEPAGSPPARRAARGGARREGAGPRAQGGRGRGPRTEPEAAGPAARPIPSQPDELSRQFQHVRVMDRVEGPRQVPRPAGSRPGCSPPARPDLPGRPTPPAPGPGAPSRRRALGPGSAPSAARGREGASHPQGLEPKQVKVRAGHARRYPRAWPPLPARPALLPPALAGLGALREYLPFMGLGGVSAGLGRGSDTQASPDPQEPPVPPQALRLCWDPLEPVPPGCPYPGLRPLPTGILTRASRRGRQSRETRRKSTCESFCA